MRRYPALLLAALALGGLAAPALGQSGPERILDYTSRVRIHADSTVTVTETIKVVAQGRKIKRGIFRDFPTLYKGRLGNTVRVGFEVLEVLRDGRPEPHFIVAQSNGERLYIGDEDRFLKKGVYTYDITYRTDRQLGYFDDFDEFYWNVTGLGWDFVIERARAVIELPPGARALEVNAFTGPKGARGVDFTVERGTGTVTFTTTRPLAPHEGLTVAVSFPKGFVAVPTFTQNVLHTVTRESALLVALLGLAVVLLYYLIAWGRVGRDPEAGPVIPLYEPPEGFTPAATRFVLRLGFDAKTFAAAVLNMAVQGFLRIEEEDDDEYVLERTGSGRHDLSAGEYKVASKLFGRADRIELKQKNHRRIKGAQNALKTSLRADFEKIYFLRNRRYLVPGLIISALFLAAAAMFSRDTETAAFMSVWLSVWSIVCYVLVVAAAGAWKDGNLTHAIFSTLFAAVFLGGELVGLFLFSEAVSVEGALVLVALVGVNVVFYQLIRAPTLRGRKIMDEIEGFKLYLSVAEQERMNLLNPPDRTPELFEKYLPYALALDVEHEWSEQFADVLAAAGADGGAYRPGWYSGRSWHGGSGLSSGFGGSFSNAISSSSSAPGSSSGGGSSGGGGGGGGGGGW